MTARQAWQPEASVEVAATLRLLAVRPWLVAGRDDEAIAAVRRHRSAIDGVFARLGWVVVINRDLVRLQKSPPRRGAWAPDIPTPAQATWFFLLVAAAEALAPRVALADLVKAARAAAAEVDVPLHHDISERRAVVRALKMLDQRGVITEVDGDLEGFVDDEAAPVLMGIHHARLLHVIANFGAVDPAADPEGWLARVEHEPDAARRMRRRLVDDTVVHAADLDAAEADWLSRRVRGDDGEPLAAAFGLHLERRVEGAAFVVPDDAFRHKHELGPLPFPATGTVPHAALLVCDHVATNGRVGSAEDAPGVGWRGLCEPDILRQVTILAAAAVRDDSGWRRELAEDPPRLMQEIACLLAGLDLLRIGEADDERVWWLSPATGRWSAATRRLRRPTPTSRDTATLSFDFGPAGTG